ncbi:MULTISPECIES: NAD(P)H-dependent oxidoreductase [Chryseobacterium]|uniref:NAD(P)H-dependent oxidoreductase n=1 Tax=Chryseobacterium sp. R2A-55 TaxID=2744445 RepID=UPI001F16A739|nr:NAD(P)H-dependent oxidoreductase [Chryseobacterium sp. R2A-55]
MNYIDALERRYSVKKFDIDKKVAPEILEKILEAGRLSASSLGLQPYKIYVVENPEVLKRLQDAFYNPSQITTCSHLIVIAAKRNLEEQYIDGYFRHISDVRNVTMQTLEGFRNSIMSFRDNIEKENLLHWNEKQAYIVLGNLMFAAALENVDSSPMEGFRQEVIVETLGLDHEKEKVSVTLALGYRAEDDPFQKMKKVRKPGDKLFKYI